MDKAVSIVTRCAMGCAALGLFAVGGSPAQAAPSGTAPSESAVGSVAGPKQNSTAGPSSHRNYPRFSYPPGFYEGVILVGVTGGQTAGPTGSYMRHEKYYDQRLREAIIAGDVKSLETEPGAPPLVYEATYLPGNSRNFDLEYGAFEHFGLGMSIFYYTIDALRQDVFSPVGRLRNLAEPLPRKRRIFTGTSASLLATYHPVARKIFDPYVSIRAGVTTFGGEAHSDSAPEFARLTNEIRNGVGGFYAVGLGLNMHLTPSMGVRVEALRTRQVLKADQFNRRDLNAYHATLGLFFNYNAFARNFDLIRD